MVCMRAHGHTPAHPHEKVSAPTFKWMITRGRPTIRLTLTSALAAMSRSTTSAWPLEAASSRGVILHCRSQETIS